MQSIPAWCRIWDRNNPAGPAPMMATLVRMVPSQGALLPIMRPGWRHRQEARREMLLSSTGSHSSRTAFLRHGPRNHLNADGDLLMTDAIDPADPAQRPGRGRL